MKTVKYSEKLLFVGRFVNEWKVLWKIGQKIVSVQSWYFNFAFEREFTDLPFSRSFEHKMNIFMRTSSIEEEEKTRWHTRRARMRNAMRSITSFSIIKSRKLGENRFFDRVRNSFLDGIFLIFAWIENRFFCYAKEEC